MIGHLKDRDLARIVGGSCSSEEAGEAVLHVAVCEDCHRRLLSRHPRQGRLFLEGWLVDFAGSKDLEVKEVATQLPQLFCALDEHGIRAVRHAQSLVRSLRDLSEAHQKLHVANSARFHTLAFVESCLVEARQQWHLSPSEAVRWASIALVAGEEGDTAIGEVYGRAVWADAMARACAYLANGHRIAGDLHAADKVLATSWRFLGEGTGTPEVHAEVLSLEGSLRRGQRRFEDAWLAAFEAERIYKAMGRREAAALSGLVGASALAEAGDLDGAIRKLRRSLTQLPSSAFGGATHFYIVQNLACTLIDAKRTEDAMTLMPEVRQLAMLRAEPLMRVRVEWLVGRLQGQLGQPELAAIALRKVRRAFLRAESPYDAALVSLDLAVLLIEDGRTQEAAGLASDLVPIFRSRGIHREAMAAGLLVARSLSEKTATAELVHQVATYLRLARCDPSYHFPS